LEKEIGLVRHKSHGRSLRWLLHADHSTGLEPPARAVWSNATPAITPPPRPRNGGAGPG
jgi:hypothetical protein